MTGVGRTVRELLGFQPASKEGVGAGEQPVVQGEVGGKVGGVEEGGPQDVLRERRGTVSNFRPDERDSCLGSTGRRGKIEGKRGRTGRRTVGDPILITIAFPINDHNNCGLCCATRHPALIPFAPKSLLAPYS